MFPGYTVETALHEYAIRFNSLLYEGYKLRAGRDLRYINIISVSFNNSPQSKEFIKRLEWAASDPDDILNLNTTPSSPQEVKRFFKGL